MKIVLLIVLLLLLVGLGLWKIFTFSSHATDYWQCKNGEWVRIGSPQISQPKTSCYGKKLELLPVVPPDSTIINFYKWLDKQKNTTPNQEYRNNPYVSSSYKKKSDQSGNISTNINYNPLICSDQSLISYKILKSSISKFSAKVEVEESFQTNKITIPFDLQAAGGEWQITKITCPN